MTVVPFGEWAPDIANLNAKVAENVLNVLCSANGYIPMPDLAPFSDALGETPTGGFTARDDSGQVTIFIGTLTKLWKLNNTTLAWDDISQTGVTYASTPTERWSFAQFGLYVVATDGNDNVQVYQLGTSTEFADLGGGPPKAKFVSVCGDFLMLSGLTSNPGRIHWSELNNITGWTPGTNSCDYQDFPDGGPVYGVTPGTNPWIIQRHAIRAGTFVPGSEIIFSFQKIHDKRGAAAPYSICTRGDITFFADSGGFFQLFHGDGSIAPIGFEKVDRTVFTTIDGATLFDIVGEIDPFYSRVYFAVRYLSTSSAFDRLIVYDWNLKRWTQVGGTFSILFPLASGTIGYTLDNLSDLTGYSLDELPYSLDSQVWQGGAPVMAAMDDSNVLGFFAGAPAEATIETQEMGDTSGQMLLVKSILPVVDTNDVAVRVGCRNRRGDSYVWSGEASPSTNTGIIRKKCRARFHKFRMKVPAGVSWKAAQGLDVTSMASGMR